MKFREEVRHSSHVHSLKPESNETPFTCDGCKETGWGLRFRCEGCNYDLHKECAYADGPITHPFFGKCEFKLRKHSYADTYCTACGQKADGFVYYSDKYSLHPCCAKLPTEIQTEEVKLLLCECVRSTKCGQCGKRNLLGNAKGWSYRSTCKKYHFHVSCGKQMVKDLVVRKWEEEHFCVNMDIITVLPDLLHTCETFGGSSSRHRSWKIAAVILNLVFSIVLGNPFVIVDFFVS